MVSFLWRRPCTLPRPVHKKAGEEKKDNKPIGSIHRCLSGKQFIRGCRSPAYPG
jgi:hypothetical protein